MPNDSELFDAIACLIEWTQNHNIPLGGLRIVLETPTKNDSYNYATAIKCDLSAQQVYTVRNFQSSLSDAMFQFMGVPVEVRAISDYKEMKDKLSYYEELIDRLRRNEHVGAHTYDLATITYPSSGKR